jgi:hypothetical protein
MLRRARSIVEIGQARRATADDTKDGIGFRDVPPKVLDWMWRVATDVANKRIPIYQVVKAQGISAPTFFDHIKRRHPLVWHEIWNRVGLGWSGKPEAGPQELVTRARMRKGAEMCVSGFTMAYAARQMGLTGGAIVGLRRLYPEYWEFLCQQIRREKGLAKGQHLAAQVMNERGQVIVGVPRGMGRHARKILRESRGLKRPSWGRLLGKTTSPKQPSKIALEAYRLIVLLGHTQVRAAEMLSREHKRKVHQGTVQKWVIRVKTFVEGGGVLPPLETEGRKPKVTPQDPAKLDYLDKADGRVRPRKSPLQDKTG